MLISRLRSASFCFSNMQNTKDAKDELISYSAISSVIISSSTGIMSAWNFIPVSCLFHQNVSFTPLPIIQIPSLDGINHPTSVYQDQGFLASAQGCSFGITPIFKHTAEDSSLPLTSSGQLNGIRIPQKTTLNK